MRIPTADYSGVHMGKDDDKVAVDGDKSVESPPPPKPPLDEKESKSQAEATVVKDVARMKTALEKHGILNDGKKDTKTDEETISKGGKPWYLFWDVFGCFWS